VNTSLNVAGEPMAFSSADAIGMLLRSDLDVLVMDDLVIRRPQDPPSRTVAQVDRALSFTPWTVATGSGPVALRGV
jgi:hypothetical protein